MSGSSGIEINFMQRGCLLLDRPRTRTHTHTRTYTRRERESREIDLDSLTANKMASCRRRTRRQHKHGISLLLLHFFKRTSQPFCFKPADRPWPPCASLRAPQRRHCGRFLQKGSNVSFCYNYALCFIFHSPQNISLLSQGS